MALAGLMFCCAIVVAQAQSALPQWSLSAAPAVTIGGDGAPSTEFSRIAGAVRLTKGEMVVADGATQQLRLFDSQGRFLRSFGRGGSGPGEFRSLNWMGRSGDTVFVYDSRLRRITFVTFGHEPRLLRTVRLTATGNRGPVFVNGRLANGRWLVETFATPGFDGPPGVHRLPASVGLIDADAGGAVGWLGQFKGMAVFVHNPTGNVQRASVGPIAFSPWLFAAASGPNIWYGESDADSLIVYSADDGRRSTVRLPILPRRLLPATIEAERKAELAEARDAQGRSWIDAKYSAQRLPRALPFFQQLLPGPGGEVWVREHTGSRADSVRYLVIDSRGAPRAWVSAPPRTSIRDAGLDYIVVVHEDDDGVETLRTYGLSRR